MSLDNLIIGTFEVSMADELASGRFELGIESAITDPLVS